MNNTLTPSELPWGVPPLGPYPQVSNALAILSDTLSPLWMVDHLINLVAYSRRTSFSPDLLFLEKPFYDDCSVTYPMLDTERRSLDEDAVPDLASLISNILAEHKYVYVWCDWYYLPGTPHYRERHFSHPTLIFGVDPERSEFAVADHYDNGHYCRKQISIPSVLSSIRQAFLKDRLDGFQQRRHQGRIYTVRLDQTSYTPCYERTRRQLTAYLESSPGGFDIDYTKALAKKGDSITYGRSCYSSVIEALLDGEVHLMPIQVLYDHLRAMRNRFVTLPRTMATSSRIDYTIEQYDRLVEDALRCKNLILRTQLKKNDLSSIPALCRRLTRIRDSNDRFVEMLLKLL